MNQKSIPNNPVTPLNTKDLPGWLLDKWQNITNLLAGLLNIPAALIMKAEPPYMQVFISSESKNNPYHPGDKDEWYGLYCETVIKTNNKLLIPNALKIEQWKNNPDTKLGMIAYLGFPIHNPDGTPFGTICVLDNQENHFNDNYESLLRQFKDILELDLSIWSTVFTASDTMQKTIGQQLIELKDTRDALAEREILLQRQNKEYQKLNNILKQKNIEYARVNEKLDKARIKAEESDKLKTEFLHNMSHEIRTPMNGIIGFSEMLQTEQLPDDKQQQYTNIIIQSARQLLKVIDDIMEISRLETQQIKASQEPVNINTLLLNLFNQFHNRAIENNTPLYINKPHTDKAATIITDASKLQRILSNLLDNALKYTTQGFIILGYQLTDNKIKFYVKDNGIGIEPSMQKKIFERFSQEEKELSQKSGGLGLGLSIAQEMAKLLGGIITLKSKKGAGSTFYLALPYTPVTPVNMQIAGQHHETQPKTTILIAEDEEVNYLYLETLLSNLNIKTLHARNGKEAIEIALAHDELFMILMDIKMPRMDGLEATQRIKTFRPNLPIIAQTAYSSPEDQQKAITSGCDNFLPKPLCKKKLNEIITHYLEVEQV